MQASLPPREVALEAVARSDASWDGLFVFAVRTTGVFCRPSCPSRAPLPENVELFATTAEAEREGYRACRRCRPGEPEGGLPPWASELIRRVAERPEVRVTDDVLRAWGIEPARARRAFQKHFGLTFQAWQRSARLGAALRFLQRGATLDDAAIDAGFRSLSGFREAFARLFGVPPGAAREGAGVAVASISTPLGPMLAGARPEGLAWLEFADRSERIVRVGRDRGAAYPGWTDLHAELATQLGDWFAGARREFDVPLAAEGTAFQREVWRALADVPYGETTSYVELARAVGRPRASRAVGQANGRNPIAIAVPCHRAIGASGRLQGYGGGLWRKQRLLAHERRVAAGIVAVAAAD